MVVDLTASDSVASINYLHQLGMREKKTEQMFHLGYCVNLTNLSPCRYREIAGTFCEYFHLTHL